MYIHRELAGPFCSGWIQAVLGSIGRELTDNLFHRQMANKYGKRNTLHSGKHKSYRGDLLDVRELLHVQKLAESFKQLARLHSPYEPANMAHPTARIGLCACARDLNLRARPSRFRKRVKRAARRTRQPEATLFHFIPSNDGKTTPH